MEPLSDSRRQIDAIFERRLEMMQQSIDTQIAESRDARGQYTEAINRVLTLQEQFMEHDRRENDDRRTIMEILNRLSSTIAAHAEAIESLKSWNKGITGILWASITGVVGWIIAHITSSK